MNEFRRQLDSQSHTFVTKDSFLDLVRRVSDLEKVKYTREGQITLIGALFGFFIIIVVAIIKWLGR
jgi:hypothetical protein